MNFCTIDLEWNRETAEQYCASFWKKNNGEVFNNTSLLLQYIFSLPTGKENQLIIYAHYGGGSDFLFLLREIVGRKDVFLNEKEFFQANSRIISFTVYHEKRRYQFRDSYAILPSSLENLSRSFLKEGKKEDSANLDEIEIKRIKQQCLNDSRLLYRIIEYFLNFLNLENLELTAASQALKDMKDRCDFSLLQKQSKEDYELFLPWFAGGHVDVYRRYASPCYQYDIKSCYSTSQFKFGCPINHYKRTKKYNENCAGLYQIKTKAQFYNPFFFEKQNQKTYWINSQDIILCTDIELRKLIELKQDFKILQGYEWELDEKFFRSFVTYWFNFRQLGQAQKEIGKIFLNAGGFGKFAIRRDRESITFGNDADYYFSPDYDIGVKKIWKDFDYSHIEIAARITAGARILLFEAQNEIGIENICYSDTDSVFSTIPVNLSDNKKGIPGTLELEDNYQRAYFLGNKFYGCVKSDNSFKAVLKGFPEKFGEEAYSNALFENTLNFQYAKKSLLKFKSALRRASDFVVVKDFLREIKKIEIKRKIWHNQINTEPYTLKNGELK